MRTTYNGFTLIELITAMTIAVILASAIYGTLSAGLNSSKQGYKIAEQNQIYRVVLDIVRDDLISASVSSTTPSWAFIATSLSSGSTYQDSVEFISINQSIDWSVTGQSDEAIIKYAIDTMPNTPFIGLIRITNRYITYPESETLNYQMVSKDIRSLDFKYYDGTEWVEEWVDTTILPKAVQITIGLQDSNDPEKLNWYTTSVRLPKA
jgi:prepilin-type N-terminal cleavage/methylation domain-containing protein